MGSGRWISSGHGTSASEDGWMRPVGPVELMLAATIRIVSRLPHPRDRWAVWLPALCVATLALLLRSWFFLAYDEAYFDSDQAIVGLMAKHITEGRAWPLFFYGQEYMLAVEAWVMAPLFLVFGPTVFALHLTMALLNAAAGGLLLGLLVRDAALSPPRALIATLPFWMAPVVLSAHLIEAQGGNPEPFLWVSLLWLVRRRPLLLGVLAAVAFLHREFSIYAIPALLVISILEWRRSRRGEATDASCTGLGGADATALTRRWLSTAFAALVVFAALQGLKPYADIMGPGTAGMPVPDRPQDNITQLVNRVELDTAALPRRFAALATNLFPLLLGVSRQVPTVFAIGSNLSVGWPELAIPLALATVLLVLAALWFRVWKGGLPGTLDFPLFLILVGTQAALAYAVTREPSVYLLRYALLALLVPVGLAALLLQAWRPAALQIGAAVVMIVLAGTSAIDHVRVIHHSYQRSAPLRFADAAERLVARGVTTGRAGYWRAYAIAFLTRERVRLTSTEVLRIQEYEDLADSAEPHVLKLQEVPCSPGTPAERVGVWFLCGP
jgi:hypothetical protein